MATPLTHVAGRALPEGELGNHMKLLLDVVHQPDAYSDASDRIYAAADAIACSITDSTSEDDHEVDRGDIADLYQFEGTPRELVERLHQLTEQMGFGRVEATELEDGEREVRIITHGWSGMEELVSIISHGVFQSLFWESSHRGGLTIYRIPATWWEKQNRWV